MLRHIRIGTELGAALATPKGKLMDTAKVQRALLVSQNRASDKNGPAVWKFGRTAIIGQHDQCRDHFQGGHSFCRVHVSHRR